MGKSRKKSLPLSSSASLIKGYLPVRLKLPNFSDPSGNNSDDETFFFVKEHRDGKSAENNSSDANSTLFVANAPVVPGIQSKLLLKALFGRFGDIQRVTAIDNLSRTDSTNQPDGVSSAGARWTNSDWSSKFPSFLPPNTSSSGKFAHVVFASPQDLGHAFQALAKSMSTQSINGERPGLSLTKLECQVLRDTTDRSTHPQSTESDDDDDHDFDDNDRQKSSSTGGRILAVAQRYRQSLAALSDRNALLEECNAVMQSYEDAEEAQRMAREAAANQPDDDGFITVTSNSVGVGKQELEQSGERRGKAKKRDRKKKTGTGATELQDFYRFQRKETRKRTLQDLRKQFEEDLQKVKKMREEHRYQPF